MTEFAEGQWARALGAFRVAAPDIFFPITDLHNA